jgi:WD40 repeat protein
MAITLFCFVFGLGTVNTQAQDISLVGEIHLPKASTLAWHPEGVFLAAGTPDGIYIYDSDLWLIHFLPQPSQEMKELDWSPNGLYLAAYGTNDVLPFNPDEPFQTNTEVWDVAEENVIHHFDENEFYISDMVWTSDGRIVNASWDGLVYIWDVFSPEMEVLQTGDFLGDSDWRGQVTSMDWLDKAGMIVSLSANGNFLWLPSEETSIKLPIPNTTVVWLLRWNPMGDHILLGTALYSVEDEVIHPLVNCTGASYWDPTGRFAAGFSPAPESDSAELILCDPYQDNLLAKRVVGDWLPTTNNDRVIRTDPIAWHPDGNLIATTTQDGYIRIWDISGIIENWAINLEGEK